MERYAALIEPAELNRREAKLICYPGYRCACVRVIAGEKDDLPLSLDARSGSKLLGGKVVEALYEA